LFFPLQINHFSSLLFQKAFSFNQLKKDLISLPFSFLIVCQIQEDLLLYRINGILYRECCILYREYSIPDRIWHIPEGEYGIPEGV